MDGKRMTAEWVPYGQEVCGGGSRRMGSGCDVGHGGREVDVALNAGQIRNACKHVTGYEVHARGSKPLRSQPGSLMNSCCCLVVGRLVEPPAHRSPL